MKKSIISLILTMLSILGVMVGVTMWLLYALTHVDDTAMRMLIDYPYPAIIIAVSGIVLKIAEKVSK